MGCSCGGEWDIKTGLCKLCGKVGPHREAPSYEQLLKENNHLRQLLAELEERLSEKPVEYPVDTETPPVQR